MSNKRLKPNSHTHERHYCVESLALATYTRPRTITRHKLTNDPAATIQTLYYRPIQCEYKKKILANFSTNTHKRTPATKTRSAQLLHSSYEWIDTESTVEHTNSLTILAPAYHCITETPVEQHKTETCESRTRPKQLQKRMASQTNWDDMEHIYLCCAGLVLPFDHLLRTCGADVAAGPSGIYLVWFIYRRRWHTHIYLLLLFLRMSWAIK